MRYRTVGLAIFKDELKTGILKRIDEFCEDVEKEETKVYTRNQWIEKYKSWSSNKQKSLEDLIREFLIKS